MDLKLQVLRQEVKQYGKKSERLKRRFLALIELTNFSKSMAALENLKTEPEILLAEESLNSVKRSPRS